MTEQFALPGADIGRPLIHWLAPSMGVACGVDFLAETTRWTTFRLSVTCDECKDVAA